MNAALIQTEILPGGIPVRIARAKPIVVEVRDRRAMNHMDPETKLTHAELEVWGRETRDGTENGLPGTTLLGRVIEFGPMGAGQGGRGPSDMSERAARVDACVARLWQIGQRCIKSYYRSSEPLQVLARREGITERHFQEVLRRSRWLIGSWLRELTTKI
jgi:hypothetical protein